MCNHELGRIERQALLTSVRGCKVPAGELTSPISCGGSAYAGSSVYAGVDITSDAAACGSSVLGEARLLRARGASSARALCTGGLSAQLRVFGSLRPSLTAKQRFPRLRQPRAPRTGMRSKVRRKACQRGLGSAQRAQLHGGHAQAPQHVSVHGSLQQHLEQVRRYQSCSTRACERAIRPGNF